MYLYHIKYNTNQYGLGVAAVIAHNPNEAQLILKSMGSLNATPSEYNIFQIKEVGLGYENNIPDLLSECAIDPNVFIGPKGLKGDTGPQGPEGVGAVVINNLTSEDTNLALSAKLGKVLNEKKVDKLYGKNLSTNDYTDEDKEKVDKLSFINEKLEISTPIKVQGDIEDGNNNKLSTLSSNIGNLSNLKTTTKTNIVSGVNETINYINNSNRYTLKHSIKVGDSLQILNRVLVKKEQESSTTFLPIYLNTGDSVTIEWGYSVTLKIYQCGYVYEEGATVSQENWKSITLNNDNSITYVYTNNSIKGHWFLLEAGYSPSTSARTLLDIILEAYRDTHDALNNTTFAVPTTPDGDYLCSYGLLHNGINLSTINVPKPQEKVAKKKIIIGKAIRLSTAGNIYFIGKPTGGKINYINTWWNINISIYKNNSYIKNISGSIASIMAEIDYLTYDRLDNPFSYTLEVLSSYRLNATLTCSINLVKRTSITLEESASPYLYVHEGNICCIANPSPDLISKYIDVKKTKSIKMYEICNRRFRLSKSKRTPTLQYYKKSGEEDYFRAIKRKRVRGAYYPIYVRLGILRMHRKRYKGLYRTFELIFNRDSGNLTYIREI